MEEPKERCWECGRVLTDDEIQAYGHWCEDCIGEL